MLSLLRESHPQAKITWISGNVGAPLVEATGLVDELIIIDENALYQGSLWDQGKEVLKVWKKLGRRSYDLVLTAHPDPRYRMISACVSAKERRVFAPLKGRPRTDEYLRLLLKDVSGHPQSIKWPEIKVSLSDGLEPIAAKSPIVLAPGGAKNPMREDVLRRWDVTSYAELTRALTQKGYPVAVVGAPSDSWVLPHFKGLDFDNLIGKTSLLELVAFYKRCRLLITHDTGPLHLGLLAGCKTLALFGPTQPREVVGSHVDVIWGGEGLACAPCYDGKNYAPCKSNLCMQLIRPQDVLRRVERALSTAETSIPCMQAFDLHLDSKPS